MSAAVGVAQAAGGSGAPRNSAAVSRETRSRVDVSTSAAGHGSKAVSVGSGEPQLAAAYCTAQVNDYGCAGHEN